MDEKGKSQVDLVGIDDKRGITFFPAFSGDLELLGPQFIYAGTTSQCHPDMDFPDGYVISHSKNHWSNEDTCAEMIDIGLDPYCRKTRERLGLSEEQMAMLCWDVFKSHLTKKILELLKSRHIIPCYVPPGYTHSLSPPDQFIQKELKNSNTSQFSTWYGEEINRQIDSGVPEDDVWVDFSLSNMKVLHAQWTVNSYESLRNRKDLLRSAWVQTGLWPILQGTFTPKKDVPRVYEIPSEENDEPPYDSESEYTSGSYHSSNEEFQNAESDVREDIPVPQQTLIKQRSVPERWVWRVATKICHNQNKQLSLAARQLLQKT